MRNMKKPTYIIEVVIPGDEPKAIGMGPMSTNPPKSPLPLPFCITESKKPANSSRTPIEIK
jgi:hypothetical protein